MRSPRLKSINQVAYYHVINQTAGRFNLLDEGAKEHFRKMLWQIAEFCGIRILTYAILDNHFHLLIEVSKPKELSNDELLKRCSLIYKHHPYLYRKIENQLLSKDEALVQSQQKELYARMFDVSQFMKELKQRFTKWYCKNRGYTGTMWRGRFKSLLVEGSATALRTIAGYIDLNPLRAGLVKDPKDYRFCGYTEALSGSSRAREGILKCLGLDTNADAGWALKEYRMILFGKGYLKKDSKGPSVSAEDYAREVREKGGELTLPEVLMCKIKFITEGHIIGSKEFLNRSSVTFLHPKARLKRQSINLCPDFSALQTLRI